MYNVLDICITWNIQRNIIDFQTETELWLCIFWYNIVNNTALTMSAQILWHYFGINPRNRYCLINLNQTLAAYILHEKVRLFIISKELKCNGQDT